MASLFIFHLEGQYRSQGSHQTSQRPSGETADSVSASREDKQQRPIRQSRRIGLDDNSEGGSRPGLHKAALAISGRLDETRATMVQGSQLLTLAHEVSTTPCPPGQKRVDGVSPSHLI